MKAQVRGTPGRLLLGRNYPEPLLVLMTMKSTSGNGRYWGSINTVSALVIAQLS